MIERTIYLYTYSILTWHFDKDFEGDNCNFGWNIDTNDTSLLWLDFFAFFFSFLYFSNFDNIDECLSWNIN